MTSLLLLWQSPNASMFNPVLLIVGIAIFYFFMIRPSMKEQRAAQEAEKDFKKNLKKGAKVITSGGIHGTVMQINESDLEILIAPKTHIKVQLSSISVEMTNATYGKA